MKESDAGRPTAVTAADRLWPMLLCLIMKVVVVMVVVVMVVVVMVFLLQFLQLRP